MFFSIHYLWLQRYSDNLYLNPLNLTHPELVAIYQLKEGSLLPSYHKIFFFPSLLYLA